MDNTGTPAAPAVPYALAAVGVLFASVCFGFVPLFSRGLTEGGLAPYAIAFYRYILAATVLLPVTLRYLSQWQEILWGMVAGAVMGLGWIGYVSALETVPASTVGVLYMTYPVFTVLIAWVLFREGPTRRSLIASTLIILAAAVAGSPASVAADQLPTLLLSLAAPFGFGFGICVLVHRLSRLPPLARISSVSLGSIIGLSPLILTADVAQVLPSSPDQWLLIIGIGFVTALIPQLIYTVCSPMIGTTRTAVIGSVELPTMFAIGFFAFDEAITAAQAIGCILILSAIAITQSRSTRTVTTVIAREAER